MQVVRRLSKDIVLPDEIVQEVAATRACLVCLSRRQNDYLLER